ncbi:hydrogenase [Clostridium sp. DJ247]|nr:hydrogenase [Clostridium sp. DJ247]
MAYKIAVASSDGKIIDQHFGRTTEFLVFEVEDNNYKFLELRKAHHFCNNGGHDDNRLLTSVETLEGCRAVLVAQIGNGAVRVLRSRGIEAFDIQDYIENALKKLIKYYSKIDVVRTREA